ncbi:MAG TPA: hypothetical protein VI338_06570 [Nitrososphaera sp.]|nr:hypothetical protein [Nitrososphaera sp.]
MDESGGSMSSNLKEKIDKSIEISLLKMARAEVNRHAYNMLKAWSNNLQGVAQREGVSMDELSKEAVLDERSPLTEETRFDTIFIRVAAGTWEEARLAIVAELDRMIGERSV